MAISTNPKPTIYRNLDVNAGLGGWLNIAQQLHAICLKQLIHNMCYHGQVLKEQTQHIGAVLP